jgi:hypothetical protein
MMMMNDGELKIKGILTIPLQWCRIKLSIQSVKSANHTVCTGKLHRHTFLPTLLYSQILLMLLGFYFVKIMSNLSDFGFIFEKGSVHGRLHIYSPLIGSFTYPGIDSQVQGIMAIVSSNRPASNQSKVIC